MQINLGSSKFILYTNNFSRKEMRIFADIAFPSGIKAPENLPNKVNATKL